MSFSDPPVSATKEFERDQPDQVKSFKFNRMMRTSRTHSASNLHILKLENGGGGGGGDADDGDSDSEGEQEQASVVSQAEPLDDSKIIEYLKKKYVDYAEDEEASSSLSAPHIRQLTEVLMHCINKNKEEVTLPVSQIRQLTDVLMNLISKNTGAKEEFFGRLMLSMPKDTLHWAVKENSSYQYLNEVKEHVGTHTMANYLINLMKTDDELARRISTRMDPDQKLKFIASLVQDQVEKRE